MYLTKKFTTQYTKEVFTQILCMIRGWRREIKEELGFRVLFLTVVRLREFPERLICNSRTLRCLASSGIFHRWYSASWVASKFGEKAVTFKITHILIFSFEL